MVIFICLEDPFDRALPVYRFENICVQDNGLLLKDEAIKIFVNASGNREGIDDDLVAFLNYLKGSLSDNELVRMIHKEVVKARLHEGWEVEYMTLYLRDQENREIGREIGREEGEARMAKLMSVLLQCGKTEDALRVTTDEEFREKCYMLYGIS